MAAQAYTDIERAIALQVIEEIQRILDLYLGTETTRGEILVRDLGIYERKTFKTLLEFYAQQIIYDKDKAIVSEWDRSHFTEKEIRNMLVQVNAELASWLRRYDDWILYHPDVRVSDIRAKRSKILRYTLMVAAGWNKIKGIVQEEAKKLKQTYSKHVIYSFASSEERAQLEERYSNTLFLEADNFREQLRKNALDRIGTTYQIDENLFDAYVAWVTGTLSDESSINIRYPNMPTDQQETVKNHHEQFIDYLTQQVFGDRGYLFGRSRENINQALQEGSLSGLEDFTDFANARAISNAYYGHNGTEGPHNYEYGPSDVELVKALNKQTVRNNALPKYQNFLDDSGAQYTIPDRVTDKIFKYNIPTEDQLKKIEENVDNAVKKLIEDDNTDLDDDDLIKGLTDAATDGVETVDPSFIEPYTDSGKNVYRNYSPKKDPNKTTSSSADKDQPTSKLKDTYKAPYTPRVKYSSRPTDTYILEVPEKTARSSNPWDSGYLRKDLGRKTKDKNEDTYGLPTDLKNKFIEQTDWKRYYGEGTVASNFLPTYRTFSGHDMVVTVQLPVTSSYSITKVIGAFQTITYSIHNDKAPVRVLGNMNAKAYVFGPRTIAGTLILTVFDRHWMKELFGTYKKIKGETERYYLMDELPKINLTISAANEYGHNAKLALYGVTFVNEGQVMSINDVYTENTYQFYATNVEYLDRVERTTSEQSKTNNLPVKNDSDSSTGSTSSTASSTATTTGTSTDTNTTDSSKTDNGDPVERQNPQTYIDTILKGKEYDPDKKQKLQEYNQHTDFLKRSLDNGIIDKKDAATSLNQKEHEEIVRQVELWRDKILIPVLRDLKSNYDNGKIKAANGMTKEERYKALYQEYLSAYGPNRLMIVQSVSAEFDDMRSKLGVTYEDGESPNKAAANAVEVPERGVTGGKTP